MGCRQRNCVCILNLQKLTVCVRVRACERVLSTYMSVKFIVGTCKI